MSDREAIARRCLENLESVVAIDSQSDESSDAVPSTPGQLELARAVGAAFEKLGATVALDDFANVFALLPGAGAGADRPPLALMVHLDTAKGTRAVPRLLVTDPWDGAPIAFPANPDIRVGVDTYPETRAFLGQRLVHGPGDAPFGLDDKLGLAECLTVIGLAAEDGGDRPPVLFVGRPDEEIGRFTALAHVVEVLREHGVRRGYTVDGIAPFEVNVENFNAARAILRFPWAGEGPAEAPVAVRLGGVNTHGATAKAEGYRSALRLAAELREMGVGVLAFASDDVRECDGIAILDGPDALAAVERVVAPHRPRGASWARLEPAPELRRDRAVDAALAFVHDLLFGDPGFVVQCEASAGRDGYSNPYRLVAEDGGVRVDVRVRDFTKDGMRRRREHLAALASRHGVELGWEEQYVNMGPRLAAAPELVDQARRAGDDRVVVQPIRGGTGVDPFLDAGIAIGNLGTGYFAPESEKEFTSLETMADHVLWLRRLLALVAREG